MAGIGLTGGSIIPGYTGQAHDCLRNGLPLDQDVYDAALWSVIGPLSEKSVADQATIRIPDFTAGSWEQNAPLDILLAKGGNTKVNI